MIIIIIIIIIIVHRRTAPITFDLSFMAAVRRLCMTVQ